MTRSTPSRAPALVILAAGASTRLGACKALVRFGADARATPLALLLDAGAAVTAASGAPALVVTGSHRDEIAAAAPPGVECAWNERWSAGRTGGVALAAARRPQCDLVLAPVDVPLVPRSVFDALARAWAAHGAPESGWLAPRCLAPGGERRHGHPLVLGRALAARARELAPGASLRELRAFATPLLALDVEELSVLDDLDTPGDLARLRRAWSERART